MLKKVKLIFLSGQIFHLDRCVIDKTYLNMIKENKYKIRINKEKEDKVRTSYQAKVATGNKVCALGLPENNLNFK